MVRAFERLKKEGLVKHLAISQHHYNNIGGGMAWEILDYLADISPTTRPSSSTPTATARRCSSGSTWRRRRTSRHRHDDE
jgi:hypothetical protein